MADKELFGNSEQLNDLISRRAAIDEIKEDKIDLTDPNVVAVFKATGDFEKVETQVMTCDRHIKILKDLPSAQPSATDTNVGGNLIDRQAAISICDNAIDLWNGQLGTGALIAVRDAIKALPSAQPDIVACGDCIHWICHDRRCGYWNHGVKPLDWCCHAERRTNG